MIPFQTWFTQIVGYCHFITDALSVRRAWVEGDHSRTSVSDFEELYEQIFDDLDSDAFEQELDTCLPSDPSSREMLTAFLHELRSIDTLRSQNKTLCSAAELLRSNEWERLVEVARRIAYRFPE